MNNEVIDFDNWLCSDCKKALIDCAGEAKVIIPKKEVICARCVVIREINETN